MRESKASSATLSQKLKVALLVQTSSEWSRQVIAGVAEYASQNGYWDFWIEPRGLYEDLRLPSDWSGDGIICRLTGDAMAVELAARYLPTVNVSWLHVHSLRFPKVVSDEAACGEMAADYFIDGGWTHIAYVGPPPSLPYSDQLSNAFEQRLSRVKIDLHVYEQKTSTRLVTVRDQQTRIGDWLSSLPKPTAILVWSTTIGHEITQIAASRGITVPDQIALLAVELDPLISSLTPIPIAYIDQSPRRVGIAAAELLAHLIKGGSPPEKPILIPPRKIAARLSVDAMFTDDCKVRSAVEFIRNNASQAIQVNDVAEHVGMSRRSIESSFLKQLNKTPSAVIRQTKISLAQHLLSETELRVQEVADRVGFFHLETFLRFFKRETGLTPTEYRMRQ
jgi:LacI family transcriptional regulator